MRNSSYPGSILPLLLILLVLALSPRESQGGFLENLLKPEPRNLHEAAARGHVSKTKSLIGEGADLNARDDHARTPLLVAVESGKHEVAAALLKKGADVEAQTTEGVSALYAAAYRNDSRMIELLLAHGAKVDARCGLGRTALFPAAADGHTSAMLTLLKHGAKVNNRGDEDEVCATALHGAVLENCLPSARTLLERGADPNIPGSTRKITPYYLASVLQFDEMAALLKSHGADPSIPDEFGVVPDNAAELLKARAAKELSQPDPQAARFDPRALVYLVYWGRSNEGSRLKEFRQAFVVGNGQYLLTAAHCVDDFQVNDGSVFARPLVLSPYRGDLVEVEIAAVDKAADVALLRAPWVKHPALRLATEKSVTDSSAFDVMAYLPKSDKGNLAATPSAEHFAHAEVEPANGKRAITLMGSRFVGPGWSGAPIMLPLTGECAGVFCEQAQTQMNGTVLLHNVFGNSVHAVTSLAQANGIDFGEVLPTPQTAAMAHESFNLLLSCFSHRMNNRSQDGRDAVEAYIRLRPDAPYAQFLAADSAVSRAFSGTDVEQNFMLADKHFREFLRLRPESAFAHVTYGCFLQSREKHAEAARSLEKAREYCPNDQFIALRLVRAYTGAKDARALQHGADLCAKFPNNHLGWFEYAGALRAFDRPDDAAEAVRKALRHGGPFSYHGRLASALAKAGKLQEAETIYEKMVKEEPENAAYWIWYAEFLIDNFPLRMADAARALDNAEKYATPHSFPPNRLEGLRKRLRK